MKKKKKDFFVADKLLTNGAPKPFGKARAAGASRSVTSSPLGVMVGGYIYTNSFSSWGFLSRLFHLLRVRWCRSVTSF